MLPNLERPIGEYATGWIDYAREHMTLSTNKILDFHTDTADRELSKEDFQNILTSCYSFVLNMVDYHRLKLYGAVEPTTLDKGTLHYVSAAFYFEASTTGSWHNNTGHNLTGNAGMSTNEEDSVIQILREQYSREGVLKSDDQLPSMFRMSQETRNKILGSNHEFFHNHHWLQVEEFKWGTVAEPFYQAILAAKEVDATK